LVKQFQYIYISSPFYPESGGEEHGVILNVHKCMNIIYKNKLFNPPPFLFASSKETAKERSKKVKKRGWDTTRTGDDFTLF
jgi:hypothetical protein